MAERTDSLQSHVSQVSTVSVRDLERAVELPARTIQFWTLMEVLKTSDDTSHPGRGRTRRYPSLEVAVAKCLVPVYRLGVPTRILIGISDAARRALRDAYSGQPPETDHSVKLMYDAEIDQWVAAIRPKDVEGVETPTGLELRYAVQL